MRQRNFVSSNCELCWGEKNWALISRFQVSAIFRLKFNTKFLLSKLNSHKAFKFRKFEYKLVEWLPIILHWRSWLWWWWWWSGRSVLNFDLPTFERVHQNIACTAFFMSIKSQFHFHQMSRKSILCFCYFVWCIEKAKYFSTCSWKQKKLLKLFFWAHDKRRRRRRRLLEVKKSQSL